MQKASLYIPQPDCYIINAEVYVRIVGGARYFDLLLAGNIWYGESTVEFRWPRLEPLQNEKHHPKTNSKESNTSRPITRYFCQQNVQVNVGDSLNTKKTQNLLKYKYDQ